MASERKAAGDGAPADTPAGTALCITRAVAEATVSELLRTGVCVVPVMATDAAGAAALDRVADACEEACRGGPEFCGPVSARVIRGFQSHASATHNECTRGLRGLTAAAMRQLLPALMDGLVDSGDARFERFHMSRVGRFLTAGIKVQSMHQMACAPLILPPPSEHCQYRGGRKGRTLRRGEGKDAGLHPWELQLAGVLVLRDTLDFRHVAGSHAGRVIAPSNKTGRTRTFDDMREEDAEVLTHLSVPAGSLLLFDSSLRRHTRLAPWTGVEGDVVALSVGFLLGDASHMQAHRRAALLNDNPAAETWSNANAALEPCRPGSEGRAILMTAMQDAMTQRVRRPHHTVTRMRMPLPSLAGLRKAGVAGAATTLYSQEYLEDALMVPTECRVAGEAHVRTVAMVVEMRCGEHAARELYALVRDAAARVGASVQRVTMRECSRT